MFLTRCVLVLLLLLLCSLPAGARELRVGLFPNLTHAQALVAMDMAAEGQGWFAQRLPGVNIKWVPFNAGPSAMEALEAARIDLTYVGPGSALLAHARTQGKSLRVLAGAVRGGSALVVRADSGIHTPQDFKNKRIATPQFGNTQDLACRAWLKNAGLDIRLTGGDVAIIPTANPDQVPLFAAGHVDGVWTVEPWVSRLELEAGGRIIYQPLPAENLTTVLIARLNLLQDDPLTIEAFVRAHEELTRWIARNPEDAQRRIAAQMSRLNRRPFPIQLVEHAWPRLEFDSRISPVDFGAARYAAQKSNLLKGKDAIESILHVF